MRLVASARRSRWRLAKRARCAPAMEVALQVGGRPTDTEAELVLPAALLPPAGASTARALLRFPTTHVVCRWRELSEAEV